MIVSHSRGTYSISFCSRAELAPRLSQCRAIITDSNVRTALGEHLPEAPILSLKPGEETKSVAAFSETLEWLANQGVKRTDKIAAVGGGVIGDLAGFVAATYLRGIEYIQVPTSLLAMVDSSVGGKVGIDLAAGKNLAGAFHPPAEVVIPLDALETLPERHRCNGMAEVWKYAFIADVELADRIASEGSSKAVIERCIQIKKEIVEADEFETSGLRATLDFGHTIGHAVESATGYRTYLHGEAISIGMVGEAQLGELLGVTQKGMATHVKQRLQTAGLPVDMPSVDPDELIAFMSRDKKRAGSGLAFSLLTEPGKCKLTTDVDEHAVRSVLAKE